MATGDKRKKKKKKQALCWHSPTSSGFSGSSRPASLERRGRFATTCPSFPSFNFPRPISCSKTLPAYSVRYVRYESRSLTRNVLQQLVRGSGQAQQHQQSWQHRHNWQVLIVIRHRGRSEPRQASLKGKPLWSHGKRPEARLVVVVVRTEKKT
ncbi:hypothetical protein LZ32DRAFT_81228 [Colletotrichum eremochloae]|nr:hypothetical protein LZ32DRAFT_81228 [Colletotrichum eremochloae]